MKKFVRNQKGFTLVEIIAVLVILGILAAFAIPKYFNLQQDAKDKAVQGALAEGKARVTQYAAQQLLSNGSFPDAYGSAVGTHAGDFTLGYTGNASSVTVTASGTVGAVSGASSQVIITSPGYEPAGS